MARPFQTFEEWFQSDMKRHRNKNTWSYPQRPVYNKHCHHSDGRKGGFVCWQCREYPLLTYETMRVEYRGKGLTDEEWQREIERGELDNGL